MEDSRIVNHPSRSYPFVSTLIKRIISFIMFNHHRFVGVGEFYLFFIVNFLSKLDIFISFFIPKIINLIHNLSLWESYMSFMTVGLYSSYFLKKMNKFFMSHNLQNNFLPTKLCTKMLKITHHQRNFGIF